MGALIGYITNKLAILMLFRPLEKKYLFTIPLPLTPGIIPRQREDLAKSIGRMVSRELITEEALKNHAASPVMQESLANTITEVLNSLLESSPGIHSKGKIAPHQREKHELSGIMSSILTDPEFSSGVSRFMKSVVQATDIKIPLKSLTAILEQLNTESSAAQKIVSNWLHSLSKKDTSLEPLLTDDILDSIERGIARELPAVGRSVVAFLEKPEIKKELEIRGISFLRKVFSRFNGIQRFFITAGQYDITLEENMGEIIEDLTAYIGAVFEDEGKSSDIAGTICSIIKEKRTKHLSELLHEKNIDRISTIATEALKILSSQKILDSLSESGVVFRSSSITKYLTFEQIHGAVSGILRMIAGEKPADAHIQIGFSSSAMKDSFGSRKIIEIFPVPGPSISAFSRYVSRNLLQLVERRSKEIIEALDIYTLVVNKINSLDIASVERLLLQVIEKHLKWINLFGALLGALIGGIQIALRAAGI